MSFRAPCERSCSVPERVRKENHFQDFQRVGGAAASNIFLFRLPDPTHSP